MRLYAVGCFIVINFCLVFAQQRNELAFKYEAPTTISDFNKTFSTQLNLNVTAGDSFNASLLSAVVENYYNSAIPGVYVVNVTAENDTSSDVTYRASYNVSYNFSSLESYTNAEVVDVVTNQTRVQIAFENDTNFENFTWAGGFSATGNSPCSEPGVVTCNTYAVCVDDVRGNDVNCTSQCFSSTICFNDGRCIQNNGNVPPHCSCVTSANNWFVGSNCKTMLNLWMPIVYFVVIFLLILLVIFITCFCVRGIDKRIEKEKRKAFIKASKERDEPMSKNQKVFVTIKSALGLKTAKEKSEPQELKKIENKEEKEVVDPLPEVVTPPVAAPRTFGTPAATSLDSTHDPTSSSTSSEFNYAAVGVPQNADTAENRSRSSSFSSREDDADARYTHLMERRLANFPDAGVVGGVEGVGGAGGVAGVGLGVPPRSESPTYAVVDKRPKPPVAMESTV